MLEHAEWSEGILRALILEPNEHGEASPRMEITRAALAPDDALGSLVAEPLGRSFEVIHPGARGLFRDGLPDLVEGLLRTEDGSDQARTSWYVLRHVGGDMPLPENLSTIGREIAAQADLGLDSADIESARFALLNFAALAASNGWTEAANRIDANAERLGPRPEDSEAMVLFEIAMWRARLEAEPLSRMRVLGERLVKLGSYPQLADQAETAARHFARNLSGAESEAMVDALGELFTRR
jgi:hypothetical protein